MSRNAPGWAMLALLIAAAMLSGSSTPPPAAVAVAPMAGPLRAIHAHLCGFHFYSGSPQRAVRAEHYCSHLSPDIFQCVIYESTAPDARLVGVEYVISEALFRKLPDGEKKLWHSHRYEVRSGQLLAPELKAAAEKDLMRDFAGTYGKTWYLWQVDRGDPLPIGLPQLMMGFTGDGQADPAMIAARDRDLSIDSAKLRAERADLPYRAIAPGADAWQTGRAFQIREGD